MKEVAFRVKKGSKLYDMYFEAKSEKNKFVGLALEFFVKRGLADSALYRLSPRLSVELTPDQCDRFRGQLKKYQDSDGLYCFKKNSKMQSEWENDVVRHINMRVIDGASMWFWPYISRGRQALWDYKDELYGYLSSTTDIKLPGDMEPMKLSEYHRIIEEVQKCESTV